MKERKQAQISKKWLSDSLLSLMEQKKFSKITIQEISKNADLDRRTFYRHFQTKEEVLDYYIDTIAADYFQWLEENPNLDARDLILMHFQFLEPNIPFLRLLKRNHMMEYILYRYQYYSENARFHQLEMFSDRQHQQYLFAFKNGDFGMWFQHGLRRKYLHLQVK